MRLYCPECSEWINLLEGVASIHARGYHWCAKHVTIDRWEGGRPVVAFPSNGKLIPERIVQNGADGTIIVRG